MSQLNQDIILKALSKVKLSAFSKNVIDDNFINSITIEGSTVHLAINGNKNDDKQNIILRKKCEQAIISLAGVDKILTVFTSAKENVNIDNQPESIPGVKNIILVASGKGGVGKSTICCHLANALAKQQYKVGVVDADIYGPSIPQLLGRTEKPALNKQQQMIPHQTNNIKSISIGYLVDSKKAASWRGPMVIKALMQLFRGTDWGQLDYLLVDLPPGTGDVQLSIAKNFPVTEAIIVSTPQELALADVTKAVNMFQTLNIPIKGIIENMSYYQPDTDQDLKHYVFGKNGAKNLATQLNIPFLGEVPLNPDLQKTNQEGIIVDNQPIVFFDIAKQLTICATES